jgi:hypothetical protein
VAVLNFAKAGSDAVTAVASSALNRPIRFTLFFSQYADSKREEVATPAEIAERVRTTTAREKQQLPWLKLATFGDAKSDKGSFRHDANMLVITGVEADYDGEIMSFDAALARLEQQGVAAVLYTSPSHTEAKPRWRVLCPLSEEMPSKRRSHLLGRVNGLLGGIFSAESWALSQSYYFGRVRQNPAHRVALLDGQPIDQHDDLDEIWIGKPGIMPGTSPTEDVGESRVDAELIRRIVTGEGFHVEMCALAGRYLARGMTQIAAGDVLKGLMLSFPEAARDKRWLDRFNSIPALAASAATKVRDDTTDGRRAVARLISQMVRTGCSGNEIRTAAVAEAERHRLPLNVAADIAAWVARRERARLGAAHA